MGTRRKLGITGAAGLIVAVVIAAMLFGCGGESGQTGGKAESGAQVKAMPKPAADTASSPAPGKVNIDLVAQNIAFDKSTITVPAGAEVTIVFDNKDEGVPHNFSLYKTPEAVDQLFDGEIITGPKTINYTFKAPETPGKYFFRCDVHPNQMTGTFVVE
jgi:plastocyanin